MPKLVISLPDAGEVILELTELSITVGRVEDNAIHIPDSSVSSYHAELMRNGDSYVLVDLGSTNGSYVNDEKVIDPVPLADGDHVRFGSIDTIYNPTEQVAPDAPSTAGIEEFATQPAEIPQGFTNASPFPSKKNKANPLSLVAILLFVLALGAAGAAAYFATQIQVPQF